MPRPADLAPQQFSLGCIGKVACGLYNGCSCSCHERKAPAAAGIAHETIRYDGLRLPPLVVERRNDDWIAYRADDTRVWESGATTTEAIGKLVVALRGGHGFVEHAGHRFQAVGLEGHVRALVKAIEARHAQRCATCKGKGGREKPCTLCGDSTYDHNCNDEWIRCPDCKGTGDDASVRPALDAARAFLAPCGTCGGSGKVCNRIGGCLRQQEPPSRCGCESNTTDLGMCPPCPACAARAPVDVEAKVREAATAVEAAIGCLEGTEDAAPWTNGHAALLNLLDARAALASPAARPDAPPKQADDEDWSVSEAALAAIARGVVEACASLPDACGVAGDGDWVLEGAVFKDAIRALDAEAFVKRWIEGGGR